jgi:hypothetical protein
MALLDALAYGAAHLQVFPLVVGGKTPAVAGGFYAATTNPETIKRYWRIPDRNIGVRTGIASGFFVLDTDVPDGEANLRRLETIHGPLPPTRTVLTPRGGFHFWFRYSGPIPCSQSKIAPHIDIKGDGGYVAVVPSVTADGTYTWLGDPEAELATAPDWLLDLARQKPKPTISERAKPPVGTSSNYGLVALDRECAALAAIASGGRNTALNHASFRLHQLVAGDELAETGIADRLIKACEKNGLVDDDGLQSVKKTIASGRAAGLQSPRKRKGAT